jgi:hypothetical protein
MSSAMPKTQLYSAVMPGIASVDFLLLNYENQRDQTGTKVPEMGKHPLDLE